MMRKFLATVAIALSIFLIIPEDAFARRGGGFRSSSRSWSSSKSSSRSWGSRSRSRSSSRATKPRSSRWSSSRKAPSTRTTKPKPTRSAAQQKRYETAKKSGTAFSSKSAATSSFKKKHATKYTSNYKTKPTTRPTHIPKNYSSGGKTYNITYNSSRGGYGYMGPSGTWVMYNAMADAAMVSMLMSRNHYYYDSTPIGTTRVVHHGGGDAGFVIGMIFMAIIVAMVFGMALNTN